MPRPVEFYAKKYGVPVKLAHALIGQESGGDDNAVSPANAVGRMQIHLPSHPNVTAAQARDPDFAMDYGFRLLSGHKKAFGSWRLALAAYNAGAGAVKRYGGVPPYRETQNYVRSILGKAGVLTTSTQVDHSSTSPTPTASSSSGGAQDILQRPPRRGMEGLSGLADLAAGRYNPTKALTDLGNERAARAIAEAAPPVEQAPAPAGTPVDYSTAEPAGEWQKWVGTPEKRTGPSAPHGPEILQFVGRIGQRANKVLTPWGNESHSLTTVDGKPSAHANGRAADIPAKGAQLRRLGYLALLEAGMSEKDARKAAHRGGLYNVGGYQIIFATNQGGNHFDHLHVGLRG